MSDDVGRELPDDLFDALWYEDVTVERGKAILITTADANGWPHPALLSFREVGARDRRHDPRRYLRRQHHDAEPAQQREDYDRLHRRADDLLREGHREGNTVSPGRRRSAFRGHGRGDHADTARLHRRGRGGRVHHIRHNLPQSVEERTNGVGPWCNPAMRPARLRPARLRVSPSTDPRAAMRSGPTSIRMRIPRRAEVRRLGYHLRVRVRTSGRQQALARHGGDTGEATEATWAGHYRRHDDYSTGGVWLVEHP